MLCRDSGSVHVVVYIAAGIDGRDPIPVLLKVKLSRQNKGPSPVVSDETAPSNNRRGRNLVFLAEGEDVAGAAGLIAAPRAGLEIGIGTATNAPRRGGLRLLFRFRLRLGLGRRRCLPGLVCRLGQIRRLLALGFFLSYTRGAEEDVSPTDSNINRNIRCERKLDLRPPALPPTLVRRLTPGGAPHDRRKCPQIIVIPRGLIWSDRK